MCIDYIKHREFDYIYFRVLNELKMQPSTNRKLEKLEGELGYGDYRVALERVLFYTYNPYFNYHVRDVEDTEIENENQSLDDELKLKTRENTQSFDSMFELLDKLRNRELTGNLARDAVRDFIRTSGYYGVRILKLILKRDLDCGVNVKLINKANNRVYGRDLIPTFNIAKASPFTSGDLDFVNKKYIAELKMNGVRTIVEYVNSDEINIYSSNGNKVPDNMLIDTKKRLVDLFGDKVSNVVFDCELISLNSSRKSISGIFNKALKGTLSNQEEIDSNLQFVCFDSLGVDLFRATMKDKSIYRNPELDVRLKWRNLYLFNSNIDSVMREVNSFQVNSEEEVMELFSKVYKEGEEGLIVKDLSSKYSFKRDKSWIKLKGINECDLRVVSFIKGEGKRSAYFGSIVFESEDKNIRVNVGGGFSDSDLEEIMRNGTDYYIGKVATIRFNEIINSKEDGVYSLFLPRFVEFRNDKDEADSLEKVMAECNGGEL